MRIKYFAIIFLAFTTGAFLAFWLYAAQNKAPKPAQIVSGTPKIGGPFTLTTHEGKEVSNRDFAGKYMLIYFGYSYCPDVCPTDLQKMTSALENLKEKAANIQPLFITIDPERDTVEQIKSYVESFHPRLIGLTGSSEQINAVRKAYRVYAKKVVDENSSTDYLMDHTAFTYFMGPDGKFIKLFAFGVDANKMAADIGKLLK